MGGVYRTPSPLTPLPMGEGEKNQRRPVDESDGLLAAPTCETNQDARALKVRSGETRK